MDWRRPSRGSRVVAAAAALLATSCASDSPKSSCPTPPPPTGPCADLLFGGRLYDEWRPVERPAILAEVGNSTYPACNVTSCGGDPFEGFGATDVWKLDGVDPTRAVIGLREGTHTYVIFVRRGVDPATIS